MVEKPLDMQAGDTFKSEKVCLPRQFAQKVSQESLSRKFPKKVCRESWPREFPNQQSATLQPLVQAAADVTGRRTCLPKDVPQFPHTIKIYMFDIIKVESQDESQIYCQDEYIMMSIKINVASFGALTGTWPSVCPPG